MYGRHFNRCAPKLAAAIAFSLLVVSSSKAGETLFRNVRVFDGEKTIEETNVLIENGLITSIGPDVRGSGAAILIDGRGKTLIPGLIDSHTHAFFESQLEQAVLFGVTTELDMMSEVTMAATLRRGREDPQFDANRADYYSAGAAVTVKGGHGTQFGFPVPTLDSSEQAMAFVRDRVREGSDYVKLIYETMEGFDSLRPTLSEESFAAAVKAAKSFDRLAVAHVSTLDGAELAIRSDADGLVHLFADKKVQASTVEKFRAAGIFVVPTMAVMSNVCGANSTARITAKSSLAELITRANRANFEQQFQFRSRVQEHSHLLHNVRQLHNAGVPILAGTDAPNPGTIHGASMHHEMWLLVEAGLSPEAALAAATSSPATCFGLNDRGRIASALRADLLLVEGDPTKDISLTANIVGVWKNGRRIDSSSRRELVAAENQPKSGPDAKARVVSDFDDGQNRAEFGAGWMESTDIMMGGKSTVKPKVIEGGAEDSEHSLAIRGNVQQNHPRFSGMMFSPGDVPMQPADLRSHPVLKFWAKGSGENFKVMLFFQERGFNPSVKSFKADKEWIEYRFELKEFDGCTGEHVLGIWFGAESPGEFRFQLDNVALEVRAGDSGQD